jgi:hypothetical protein
LLSRLAAADQGQTDSYREKEVGALRSGHLFCFASGNLGLDEMAQRFFDAEQAMIAASRRVAVGFSHVYEFGRIVKMWPTAVGQR